MAAYLCFLQPNSNRYNLYRGVDRCNIVCVLLALRPVPNHDIRTGFKLNVWCLSQLDLFVETFETYHSQLTQLAQRSNSKVYIFN